VIENSPGDNLVAVGGGERAAIPVILRLVGRKKWIKLKGWNVYFGTYEGKD